MYKLITTVPAGKLESLTRGCTDETKLAGQIFTWLLLTYTFQCRSTFQLWSAILAVTEGLFFSSDLEICHMSLIFELDLDEQAHQISRSKVT